MELARQRIDKAIEELNNYEEDFNDVSERSWLTDKKTRKEKWTVEEYQETLEHILKGE